MTVLEVRGIATTRIRGYLVDEFGGSAAPDGSVSGDGWYVRFIDGARAQVGRISVPVLRIEVDGAHEAAAAAFLRQKTMRGGG